MTANAEGKLVVQLQRHIAAPTLHVWDTAASEAGMKAWLGPHIFEPHVGGRLLIDVLMDQRWIMYGNVTVYAPPHALAVTWNELDPLKRSVMVFDTLVTLTFEEQDGGTLVTLRHDGFDHLPDAETQYNNYKVGWESLNDLEMLAEMVEGTQ